MLVLGKIEECRNFIENKFSNILKNNNKLNFSLHCLEFIEILRKNEIIRAVEYSQKYLSNFSNKEVLEIEDKEGNFKNYSLEVFTFTYLILIYCKLII